MVKDMNIGSQYLGGRYLVQWFSNIAHKYNTLFTYFKGLSNSPQSCKDAYLFCRQYCSSTDFPIMVAYWPQSDRTVKISAQSSLDSILAFENPISQWLSKNKPQS